MSRPPPPARRGVVGPLLGLVLLACAGVIVMDQLGYFPDSAATTPDAREPSPGDLTPGGLPLPAPAPADAGVPEPVTPDLSPITPAPAPEPVPELTPAPAPAPADSGPADSSPADPGPLPPPADGEGYGDLR